MLPSTRSLNEKMTEPLPLPLPLLIEGSIEIAWDYLGRSGQISDPEFTSKFLLTLVELNVCMGERGQLMLVNRAISDFERSKLSQVE